MPELRDQIAAYIDSVAPLIEIDEALRDVSEDVVPGEIGRTRRITRRSLLVAAAASLVLAGGVLVGLVTRSSPSPELIGPDTSQPSVGTEVSDATAVERDDPLERLAPFGTERSAPPLPEGWKTLDFDDFRFAVPRHWEIPASPGCWAGDAGGVVLLSNPGDDSGCSPASRLPPSYLLFEADQDDISGQRVSVGTLTATLRGGSCFDCPVVLQFDNGYRVSARGPQAQSVLDTFTDSGARRVLQSGPQADRSKWRLVEFDGVSLRVPRHWAIDDLPASYSSRTLPNGNTETSGRPNPGSCGDAMFPAGQVGRVSLGESPFAPRCPFSLFSDLRPGNGLWIRDLGDVEPNELGRPVASVHVRGLDLTVIDVRESQRQTPQSVVDVIARTKDSVVWITLGVRFDASIGRSILYSLAASDLVADPPPEMIATPSTVIAGELVELTFPTETGRGISYTFSRRNGAAWDQPSFLLTSDASKTACPGCPLYRDRSEEWGTRTIGTGGPGPDRILIPPSARPGRWRICAYASPTPLCTEIEVLAE